MSGVVLKMSRGLNQLWKQGGSLVRLTAALRVGPGRLNAAIKLVRNETNYDSEGMLFIKLQSS